MAAPKLPTLKKKDQTPTRQVSGTQYTVQTDIKPPGFEEIGSSQASSIREVVPELANRRQATLTYKKMVRGDASVRVSLRAGKTPILGGDYYIDAYDETDEHQAIWEFVDFNIFHAMTTPWLVVLQNICQMLEDGFFVAEPVYELREWAPKKTNSMANRRKYTMLRKLAPRPASTITQFNYDDNGGPIEILQQAIQADGQSKEVKIPIEKAMVFTFDKSGGNLEGESILRSAYPHWYYKDILYRIDAIQKERHGIGVPDIELGPGHTPQDRKIAHELGANLRTNESSYIVRTNRMTVGFAELSGNLVNALESANHHDNMIMKNIMVQFLNLGIEGSGGGRATGATAADMFLKAMKYLANLICEYFNQYLIPNLVAYNFETDQFPKMKVRNIGEAKDVQMWTAGIANMVKSGAITMDLETEQWFRNVLDIPVKLEDRPEFTEQQRREQILLQGQTDEQGNPVPISKTTTTTPGGVVLPAGASAGGQTKPGNVGKSPTSGA